MKILLIGSKGMLGTELAKTFAELDLTCWDMEDINIVDKNQVFSKVKGLKPEVIVNAAAYTAVDLCEDNQELAMQVNGEGPGNLAAIAKKIGAILVHYSTDYIFGGEKKDGYEEDYDVISPVSVYGHSKALGEKLIKESGCNYYILRSAWLFGKNGKNFVDTMIKLASEKSELKVVNDQIGCPTYAVDLAQRTKDIIMKKEPFGIYHCTNFGSCSWYDFAVKIFKLKNMSIKVIPCSSEEFPRPAKRPHYSILLNTKLPPMRKWQSALSEYLS